MWAGNDSPLSLTPMDSTGSAPIMMENTADAEEPNTSQKGPRNRLPKAANKILKEFWDRVQDLPTAPQRSDLLQQVIAAGGDWYTTEHLKRYFYTKKAEKKKKALQRQDSNTSNASTSGSVASQPGSGGITADTGKTGGGIQYTPEMIAHLEMLLGSNPKPTSAIIDQWATVLGIDAEAIQVYIQIKESFSAISHEPQDRKPVLSELRISHTPSAFGSQTPITPRRVHLPTPSHSISPEPVSRADRSSSGGPMQGGPMVTSIRRQVDPCQFLIAAGKTLPREQVLEIADALVHAGVVEREWIEHIGLVDHHQTSDSNVNLDSGENIPQQAAIARHELIPPQHEKYPLYELIQQIFASETPPVQPQTVPRTSAEFIQAFTAYDTIIDDVMKTFEVESLH